MTPPWRPFPWGIAEGKRIRSAVFIGVHPYIGIPMPTLETIATVLAASCAGMYALAAVGLVCRLRRGGMALFAAAWVLNAVLVAFNWRACGQPPFGNMYHVLTVLSLCFLPAHVVLRLKDGLGWNAAYFAAASVLPLIGTLCMEQDVVWRRMPALQSPWFVPHVLAYMFSYSLAAVAFLLTVAGWLQRRGRGEIGTDLDNAGHHTLRLAFPFMTFGLLSGALWAEEAWGTYWSWDIKETWSLITWMVYAICLHCRTRENLRRFAMPAHVLGFMALLTTFLLVNLLPKLSSALHSYATAR